MNVAEAVVQNGEEHDDVLHMKGAPVNMRLFKSNRSYRSVIMKVIDLMIKGASISFDDYPKVQGISGANVGIPFNIVVVIIEGGQEIFINPKVINRSGTTVSAKSNCGSLNLQESIKIERYLWVEVEWHDIDGGLHQEIFKIGDSDPVSSATLQHEMEHNLGILITDK